MKDFKGKVVVITGGATGIGKAVADKFGEVSIYPGRNNLRAIQDSNLRPLAPEAK